MMIVNVVALSLVILLQVLSCDGLVQDKFSCSSICDGIDSGFSGLCCGKNVQRKKKKVFGTVL